MRDSIPTPLAQAHSLPPQLTSFVGRKEDVAEVLRLLTSPDCRLLTLTGPGGIGKTRLALQAAHAFQQKLAADVSPSLGPPFKGGGRTAQGVYFVPLQTVETGEGLISAVADGLGFPLSGQEAPQLQLLNYLRDKRLLLVLDNFEQLLEGDGALFLADLLKAAFSLKLLITSREVLSLQEEWLYPVQGLPYPVDESGELSDYSAVQLFAERAQRVRRDFSLTEEEAGVRRICQLVEGMPLALELAASWAKTMPAGAIADEIERSLNFLTSSLRDIPEQHRSIRAVFDHSWALLSREEQQVFQQLSIFRGGFRKEAAEQVTGASLPTLSSLVDKSLLRWDPDGRYQIHELLRQYAEEHLGRSPEEPAEIYDLHCAYYARFLESRRQEIVAGRQREVIAEITADLENIRAAWQWAVDQTKAPELHQSIATLDLFYQMKSRYLEGAEALEKAAQSLGGAEADPLRDKTLGEILVCQGWYGIRLGQFEKARALFERSQAIFQRLGISHPSDFGTDPLLGLGTLANIQGDYPEAAKLGEAARRQNKASGDRLNLMVSHYVLANAALAQGQYETAHHHARQAYTMARAMNERWSMAYYLSDLGHVARALGDYGQARQHYQAAYDLRKAFDDPEGMAVVLNHLAEIALLQDDPQTAEELYGQSLRIYRDIGDRGGLAVTLNGLGQAACARRDYGAAQQQLQEALQITTQIQFTPLTLAILANLGELLLHTGSPALAVELLTFIQHHPAAGHETKTRAQQILANHIPTIDTDTFETAVQRGKNNTLETMVASAQTQLALPLEVEEPTFSPAPLLPHSPAPPPSPALVEPLTERELEVLSLIAEGLTNREIAERLSVVIGTVKAHNNSIYGKLGVNSRVQALNKAQALNLL